MDEEDETLVKRLRWIVEKTGICGMSKKLGIDIKTLKKILNGYDKYPYYLHKRIKEYIQKIK
ncbi:MAG: hypothetical protein LBG48_05725 [Rickettsiales bacterium]|nr:hypothetical protein [Rickettsiales bacterium]